MKITTTLIHNDKGTPKIVARGMGKQKTTNYDHGLSHDTNHGHAAANLIIHVQHTSPELQYGDNIISNVVRSLDAGYGTHTTENGAKHVFEV